MGRSREFKREEALGRAMEVFWRRGYENCSVKDLLQEMDILNGSFYNCFGSKKQLFLQTLEHYNNTVGLKRVEALRSDPDIKVGLRAMFKMFGECMQNQCTPKGCMVTSALQSGAGEDPEIRQFLENQMHEFEEFFLTEIKQAQAKGQISPEVDAEKVTPVLVAYIHGIMSLTHIKESEEKLALQTDFFLKSLGL